MGNSSSVPYPRYGWCISPQTTDHCLENHVDPLPSRTGGSTKRRDSKGRHRRSVSAVFSFNTGGETTLPAPEGKDDGADVESLDLTTSPAHEDLININTATEEELMTLSGVNRATARNIVEHRRQIGGFRKIGDVALVTGVGATRFQQFRPEICVGRIPRSTSGYGVGGERFGMTRNSSASSSGIDMSADSVSARSAASQLLEQLSQQQIVQQQLGQQQPGQQQLGQQLIGQQQPGLQQEVQQQLGQQQKRQCSCSDSLCQTYGALSLGNEKELEILMKYSSESDRTRVSDLSLKSHQCDMNKLSTSVSEQKISRPRAESTSTRRSFGLGVLTKSKRRQSPSSRSVQGTSGRHSRQPSATFTEMGASAGCYPPPVSPIRAIQSSADILPHERNKNQPDSKSLSTSRGNRDDLRALGRMESSPSYLSNDRYDGEGEKYPDVLEDFMRVYGPLLQKSRRPVEDLSSARSDVPHDQGFRVAAWDLDGCSADKVSNLGVKEVVALTILENQFTILALHNLSDGEVVLKTICQELNAPTVPRVRRWTGRRGLWHYVIPNCDINKTANCGFIYDMTLIGNVHQSPSLPGVCHTDQSCHLSNDVKTTEHLFTATFEISHTEVAITILSHHEETTASNQILSSDLLLNDALSHILIGRVPDNIRGNLIELKEEQPIGEESRKEVRSSMWLSHQTSKLCSGHTQVIREGLTSPWIPQGWAWGGAVSQTGPIFSQFYLTPS